MTRTSILTVLAVAWFAGPAQAQFDDTGYGDHEAVVYHDRAATVEARNRELEAELARYRQLYEQSLSGHVGNVGCTGCDGGCDSCCLEPCNWFDCCCCGPTWSFSLGGDAWRDFGDVSLGNNFGNRFALDATWGLGDSGTRGHLGMAYGIYDYHGRIDDALSSAEQQVFLSAGVYHRGCCCGDWSWAASYDFLNDNHYGAIAESIDLHQVRFLVGRMMNACNEVGVWGAFGVQDDEYGWGGEVEVQDQVNLYWRRYWDFGGETMLYAGLAQTNMLAPEALQPWIGNDDDLSEFVIGLRGIAPLTCNLGVYGGFHYVIPSASGGINQVGDSQMTFQTPAPLEENWSVGFGLIWVGNCGCSLPLLPTADNGSMGKRTSLGSDTFLY